MASPFMLDTDNFSKDRTELTRNSGSSANQVSTLVLFAVNTNSWGLRSYGTGRAAGVFGINNSIGSDAKGVHGLSDGGGIGVIGECQDREAERAGRPPHGIGVYGEGPDAGVWGSGDYAGVIGNSPRNGVEGTSEKEAGVLGYSYEGVGVEGSTVKGAAGRFYGDVYISGQLYIQGLKSAVVPFPDGSHRRLYCQESPESWFEDFGEAKLVNGRSVVSLDKGFIAVTKGEYYVFVTPLGDCNGLFVAARSRRQFTVRELGKGRHTARFSYRVVGRRKDITAKRFERVAIPARPKPPAVRRRLDLRTVAEARGEGGAGRAKNA